MCSQADDPTQHVSDDTLRAALPQAIADHASQTAFPRHHCIRECASQIAAVLAASATDEQGRREERYWTAYDAASATDSRTIGRPGEYVGWAGPKEPTDGR